MTETVDAAGYDALIYRDWNIPQGADTSNVTRYGTKASEGDQVVWVDLTAGWKARAQIRKKVGGDVWVTFTSEALTGPRIDLTSDGHVHVILPNDTTEGEPWNAYKQGVYDVEIEDASGFVTRLVKGSVYVTGDATRDA